MYCSKCGGVVDGHQFCPQCGNPVRGASQNVTAPNKPAQTQGRPTQVLVFGIIGVVISGLIGLIFSIIALAKGNNYIATYGNVSTQVRVGRILGIVGIITSVLTIVLCVILVILLVNNAEFRDAFTKALESSYSTKKYSL